MSFFKTKKFFIILGIAAVGGLIAYSQVKKANKPPEYETVKVQKGDLTQTVEATGKVESQSDLSLRFEVPGVVERVNVAAGAKVKAGDILASLKLSELNAAVAQAQANLNQKIAGATQAEKDYYKAVLDQAAADLENSQVVVNAYEDAVVVLQASIIKLDDGLVQADNILGIDNASANDQFQSLLSVSDLNKLNIANSQYLIVKNLVVQAKLKIVPLTGLSASVDIDAALLAAIDALVQMNQLLITVGDALGASQTGINLSQTELAAKKTTIDTTRTSVNTQFVAVTNAKQTIADAKVSLKVKEAVYNQALANYKNKSNPVREVDVAALRAALSQAVANRNKAIIRAPIAGVVTSISKKAGEFAVSSEEMVRMFVPHYEVKVDIPETDISKLKMGDTVEITLDAFGDETKFSGKVINMEPGSTDISDVVYYKVTITINDSDKDIKPGMTANVKINTDSRPAALFIPLRSVRTNDDSGKFVKVLKNGQSVDVNVKLGIRADNGQVEILEGLSENDEVILSVK
ncbi:MAG: efflux RND transporter periplasmic adaptor subunit [Candidatus Magasanikbacteria bacterium]|nr:efflux RND transporter periplasmic adaptor subunit [Candidatus Magasanikbacteria bacterium]